MTLDALTKNIGDWFAWAPSWAVALTEFGIAIVLALLAYALLRRAAARVIRENVFWRSMAGRVGGPVRMVLVIVALAFASTLAPLNSRQVMIAQHGLLLCIIFLGGWLAVTAMRIWLSIYLRQFEADSADTFLARKHVTQTHILSRVGTFFIWIVAISAALMTFEGVRQYGVSILASAGAAGVVVGLALQPVLKNLIAGIQIAITQPIRIGDSLNVEKEMGFVEDIKATYVVVRLWDLRRMVLPLSYFIEQPFQNWSRESTNLLGAVLLYLDYSLPLEPLRSKTKEIVEDSPLWDRKTFSVQVTDFRDSSMEVRVLVSAADSGKLFDLRCEIREKVIAFLQSDFPQTLPRLRTQIDGRVLPKEGNGPSADGGHQIASSPQAV